MRANIKRNGCFRRNAASFTWPNATAPASRKRIDVERSSYHHLSQTEIGDDQPCSRQISGMRSTFSKGAHMLLLSWRHQYHLRVTDSHHHRSAAHCKLDPDGG